MMQIFHCCGWLSLLRRSIVMRLLADFQVSLCTVYGVANNKNESAYIASAINLQSKDSSYTTEIIIWLKISL